MEYIVGVDIGNSTTEVAIGKVDKEKENIDFISDGIYKTTGLKGTIDNIDGILNSLNSALDKVNLSYDDLALIRLNEATPVIGDLAMETITETVITESTMIGHDPWTPGGIGLGVGVTTLVDDIDDCKAGDDVILIIPGSVDFADAANIINQAKERGVNVNGAVAQKDDAVLIVNRLDETIPVIDEVKYIDRIPLAKKAAVEVARPGGTIDKLSNPYGIATIFDLDSEDTKHIFPVARSLIGNRSAVVIRTPAGDIEERKIPAGEIVIIGDRGKSEIGIDAGAEEIMDSLEKIHPIEDVKGQPGTNVGGMLDRVKVTMSKVTDQPLEDIRIKDILAVNTFVPKEVKGGLAEEYAMENAVGLAAMVKTSQLPMRKIADKLEDETNVEVEIAGVEANMAILGALTTPGTDKPFVILDMGGGSTDAAMVTNRDNIYTTHLAGAGDMTSLLINIELGLGDINLAELIKKNPLAKVESVFHVRHEDGSVSFFDEPLAPKLFGRVIILSDDDKIPIPTDHSLDKIRQVRRDAKNDVFVRNSIRALKRIIPTGNIRDIDFVVMVGGSAIDFEIPTMISNQLSEYGVVAGRGNIRGVMGPRNAVATGLVLSYLETEGSVIDE
ncbi:diol dehydratase reactivase subunit alpha [Halanaerobium hydrogeniformans]|uniref:Diol/glycerol dehydratase reactivating factor large subunit n=1 Tax=Halanaerobium hydrogeniformans TaxID=656519 RepID=E4RMA0_HALHG|nr:diol dehydratase reactivase subunit alpha [Halanaerobium hydrogeniformans]ADQ14431.1 Diol/glycerol dehydratase reactivating factor large subunit [Halanaerobium hydrogeniformans]